ncbi:unnamed protein product [Prorocentrum cordatum]|uniref:HECT domain-containing protein n=1 Tax=Prorocentrum cordatum TaxID=2364126 RepID=A0ABN9VPT6_9DINO|nr:unnamed protein product [Polarella glacialis]
MFGGPRGVLGAAVDRLPWRAERAMGDAGGAARGAPAPIREVRADPRRFEFLPVFASPRNKLYDALQKAADAFREGLLDIVGGSRATCPLFALLAPAEIVRLWAGRDVGPEGLRRWRAVAVVSGEVREQADWLWELLEEGGRPVPRPRARVLHRRAPPQPGGLTEVRGPGPYDGGDEQLPHAMTCGNMLQLPRYSSKDVLRRQLAQVLTELGQGFGVV